MQAKGRLPERVPPVSQAICDEPRAKTPTVRAVIVSAAIFLAVSVALAGCGGSDSAPTIRTYSGRPLPADYVPLTIGRGPDYRSPATSARARNGRPIDGRSCSLRRGPRYGAHLEIFAHRHVVAIPAGIGIAPPFRTLGARVFRGHCYYPAITTDPTGVIALRRGARITLGEFFDIWGQPLSHLSIGPFTTLLSSPVVAYFDGRRWSGDPRAIPLRRHSLIVLEVDGPVLPHRVYLFPPGL